MAKPAKSPARTLQMSREERMQLEAVLLEFDQHWTPDALPQFVDRVAGDATRIPALVELVRVDLERHWAAGREVFVEDYFRRFSELRSSGVAAELAHGEHQAREVSNRPLESDELERRFPSEAEQVRRLIDQARDSHAGQREDRSNIQASIDTSRSERETHWSRNASPTSLPESFGRYRIIRQLGEGAMGAVYLAHDTQLDRQVALKTPSLGVGEEASDLVERFYREARAAANLRHHNICPVHDVGQIDGTHYITMAYIEGRLLSDYKSDDKPLTEETAATMIQKLAQALAVAHAAGIVHRDLKPANIMVDQNHEPVVMDFGLALRNAGEESKMTKSGVILGTPAYMSPEQVEGNAESVGPAADQYSLGVILYEMLCGRLPFTGSVAAVIGQIMSKQPKSPSTHRGEVDAELEAICIKMMAKSATDRFASMEEVADVIAQWLKTKGIASPSHVANDDASTATLAPTRPLLRESLRSSKLVQGDSTHAAQTTGELAIQPLPQTPTKSPPRRAATRGNWPVVGIAAGGLLLLAVVLLISSQKGMLRIEVSDSNLQVLVDGDLIDIKDNRWEGKAKARNHRLALRLGGVEIPFNAKTQRFTTKDGLILIKIGNVDLTSNRFEVARRGTTVLKFEFVPHGVDPSQGATRNVNLDRDWGSATPKLLRRFDHAAGLSTRSHFAALSPNGAHVAHRLEHELPVQLFREGGSQSVTLPEDIQSAIAMDYNADGTLFATGHMDGTVRLWNASSLQPIGQPFLTDASEWVRWISLSDDGSRLLAVTGSPTMLYAWKVASQEKTMPPFTLDINIKKAKFAATSDAQVMVAADSLGDVDSVTVWDVAQGKARDVRYLPNDGEPQIVFDVDISGDGEHIAVGCKQTMVFVFDASTGDVRWSGPHGARVSAVRFSPDGRRLATCGGPVDSEDLHLWDWSTGKELVRWHAPVDASRRSERYGAWVTMLEFSRDGSRMLTAGANTPICVWSLTSSEGVSQPVSRPTLGARPMVQLVDESDGQRAIAETIISLGGAVGGLGPAGRYVYRIPQLPKGDLRINRVAFNGANDKVRDEHMRVLASLPQLEGIIIGQLPALTNDGYKSLVDCKRLKELTFVASALTDERLAELKDLPLNGLYLCHTDLTNDGLKVLADMPVLRRLTIGNSRKTHKYGAAYLTDAGLAHLASVEKLSKLWVYGPGFTDDAVEHLAELKQVDTITLGTPEMTDAAISELRKRLPDCEIVDKRRAADEEDPEDQVMESTNE